MMSIDENCRLNGHNCYNLTYLHTLQEITGADVRIIKYHNCTKSHKFSLHQLAFSQFWLTSCFTRIKNNKTTLTIRANLEQFRDAEQRAPRGQPGSRREISHRPSIRLWLLPSSADLSCETVFFDPESSVMVAVRSLQ
jgi:hypothetical protein